MSKIYNIAITGGPCSGKTSVMDAFIEKYANENRDVFICPEAATQVIKKGVARDDMFLFEKAVALQQLENEKAISQQACDSDKDEVIVFFDRPITDCFSYVEDTDAFAKEIGKSIVDSWSAYDAVLMLQTADEEHYINNDIRTESYQQSIDFQNRLLKVMVGHPHLRFIPNKESMEQKKNAVFAEVDAILQELETEKKYLIEYPDLDELNKLPTFKTEISQTYLLSDVATHRIRKRGACGNYTYFETFKFRISGSVAKEIERTISESEYNELMLKADPNRKTIEKFRYCFLYENQYFELDVFPFWSDKALLEIELKSLDDEVKIPDFIKVIKDVSDDPKYKNSYLARMI